MNACTVAAVRSILVLIVSDHRSNEVVSRGSGFG